MEQQKRKIPASISDTVLGISQTLSQIAMDWTAIIADVQAMQKRVAELEEAAKPQKKKV